MYVAAISSQMDNNSFISALAKKINRVNEKQLKPQAKRQPFYDI